MKNDKKAVKLIYRLTMEYAGFKEAREAEYRLVPLKKALEKDYENVKLEDFAKDLYFLVSKNIIFLRYYLGFANKLQPYMQAEFAEALDISVASVRRWELGQGAPTKRIAAKIAAFANSALNVSPQINPIDLYTRNLFERLVEIMSGREFERDNLASPLSWNSFAEAVQAGIYQKEERYKKFFDAVPAAIFIVQNEKIVFANDNTRRLLGFNISELTALENPIETIFINFRQSDFRDELKSLIDGKIKFLQTPDFIRRQNLDKLKCECTKIRTLYAGHPAIMFFLIEYAPKELAEFQILTYERIKALIENSKELTWIIDENGVITFQTESIKKYLGKDYRELYYSNFIDLVSEDTKFVFEEALKAVVSNPENSINIEFDLIGVNSEKTRLEAVLTNRRYDYCVRGIIINAREISEYRALLKYNPIKIFKKAHFSNFTDDSTLLISFTGKIVYHSIKSDSIFKKLMGEIKDASINELFSGEINDFLKRSLIFVLNSGENVSETFTFKIDNEWYHVEFKLSNFLKKYVVCILKDKSRIYRQTMLGRSLNDLNKSLIRNINQGIVHIDTAYKIKEINKSAENILKEDAIDAIDKNICDTAIFKSNVIFQKTVALAFEKESVQTGICEVSGYSIEIKAFPYFAGAICLFSKI